MVVPKPWIKFTVKDYMSLPEGAPYQLLDGEMVLAPSPTQRHQRIAMRLAITLENFVSGQNLGRVWFAPLDVVLSDYDVAQLDLLFVSNDRAGIVTEANIQGAPDLLVEIPSPSTAHYDREYKVGLYGRQGVWEYWLVDPDAETVEVLTESDQGLTLAASYQRGESMSSPLLQGLDISLGEIFGRGI